MIFPLTTVHEPGPDGNLIRIEKCNKKKEDKILWMNFAVRQQGSSFNGCNLRR